jgi:hypothetical protein
VELNAAGRRLRAALAAVTVKGTAPELGLAHRWLDNWRGVGQIAEGMHRAGWDLQLTEYGDGHWRATFYVTGMAHSVVGGSAWEPTPWVATQQAAWMALHHKSAA